jgi:hypothetical protein
VRGWVVIPCRKAVELFLLERMWARLCSLFVLIEMWRNRCFFLFFLLTNVSICIAKIIYIYKR